MARNDSCLRKKTDPLPPLPPSNCLPNEYIDQQTSKCLQSCNSSSKYPYILDGKIYCGTPINATNRDYLKVDSSVYKFQDGTYLTFFVFSHQLTKDSPEVQVMAFS